MLLGFIEIYLNDNITLSLKSNFKSPESFPGFYAFAADFDLVLNVLHFYLCVV